MIDYIVILFFASITGNILLWFYSKKIKNKKNSIEIELGKTKTQLKNQKRKYNQLNKTCEKADILARVVKQSSNAIMVMDANGNIQLTNKGFYEMYEYTFQEFTNSLGNNYRQTSFNSNVEQRLETVAQTKSPIRYEALNITKTGKKLWTQTALVPILDKQGRICNLATIDTDIDKRVIKSDQLVSELVQLNEKIDQLDQQFTHLDTEFGSLFKSIIELYQLVEKTDEILNFIKYISDETRVLGFNATIEANRAGQYGTSFQVITKEIIDISQQTIGSVDQITQIFNSINSKQKELIELKDDSKNRIIDYQSKINELKKEVVNIEKSISEFKSLA